MEDPLDALPVPDWAELRHKDVDLEEFYSKPAYSCRVKTCINRLNIEFGLGGFWGFMVYRKELILNRG